MTCDEVRHTIETRTPQSVTRAERAAIGLHLDTCKSCQQYMDSNRDEDERYVRALIGEVGMSLIRAANQQTIDSDRQDPEYIQTREGK